MDIDDLDLPDIPLALAVWDCAEEHYGAIHRLVNESPSPSDLVTSATALLLSTDSATRALGLDVLGELLQRRHINTDEFFEIAGWAIADASEDIRYSAAVALRGGVGEAAERALIMLAGDPDACVRFQAVFSLPTACGDRALSEEALEVLITAAGDSDDDVREWAIFGIAVLTEFDTPRIRQLLFEALEDPVTQEDARTGLGRRGAA